MPEEAVTNKGNLEMNVDIVYAIDVTGSMAPIIDTIKNSVKGFEKRLQNELLSSTYQRQIDELRIRIVAFRDFDEDGQNSINQSNFFTLPEEEEELYAYIDKLEAFGGGDVPETAIDAFSIAMNSDWNTEGQKKRQIIFLFTDAPTKGPGHAPKSLGLPSTMEGVVEWWQDPQKSKLNRHAQRLIVYAPEDESWEFLEALDNTVWERSVPSEGLSEVGMDTILALLCNSI
ncbi:MAG: VWA domain-containing protein [archaeon]|nr:VWA domain-containing protein [archaeon]